MSTWIGSRAAATLELISHSDNNIEAISSVV